MYVGGLRFETDEQAVRDFFELEYGDVLSVKVGVAWGSFVLTWSRHLRSLGRAYWQRVLASCPFTSRLFTSHCPQIIVDKETGSSRGFCFVTFAREDDASAALATCRGKVLDGASVHVNIAKAQTARQSFDRGFGRGR